MKGDTIKYREGSKYTLDEPYSVDVPIYPPEDISIRTVKLTKAGRLTMAEGFAWNGASGPTQDTPDSMRGGLIHDALYKLMCAGQLSTEYRSIVDTVFAQVLVEDGMDEGRVKAWYVGVREFGEPHARAEQPVLEAPRPFPPYRQEWPDS